MMQIKMKDVKSLMYFDSKNNIFEKISLRTVVTAAAMTGQFGTVCARVDQIQQVQQLQQPCLVIAGSMS